MDKNVVQSVKEWGLLANGSSGPWYIDLDESTDGGEWNMQIDGPQAYVRFEVRDLQVIPKALAFLRTGIGANITNGRHRDDEKQASIKLGLLGTMSVSIVHDDEVATRWFIIIDGEASSLVRITLDVPDVEMLVDALQQVMDDLPD